MFKQGDKVHYTDSHTGKKENGIVKHDTKPGAPITFVVYRCAEDWKDYQNYTAASTLNKDLAPGWFDEGALVFDEPDDYVTVNGVKVTKETRTRYGYPKEFVLIGNQFMMRSNDPYGTWPIELLDEN